MTDYNDGKWHAWSGESIQPASIHDKSIVEYIWHCDITGLHGKDQRPAGWDENDEIPSWDNILKFRVIHRHKEPPKPREYWVCGAESFYSRQEAVHHCGNSANIIHVREVLE